LSGSRTIQAHPPAEAALGAAAGLTLWFGSWVLHTLVHPEIAAPSDPLFWVLGCAPVTLAGFGWLFRDRQQAEVEKVELCSRGGIAFEESPDITGQGGR